MKFDLKQNKNDILSGLTVALALVPEAIAFAFVCHVSPVIGLYAAVIMGLTTAILGGRPGMISGATGAIAVVLGSLVLEHGVEYLFAAVLLMGILQITAGFLKLGKFVRLIPHPVMLGFVNGLAIVIFMAQLGQFKTGVGEDASWLAGTDMYVMLALVGITLAICYILPMITKAIPASLTAIVTVTIICIIGGKMDIFHYRSVLDYVKLLDPEMTSLKASLPPFHFPAVPLNFETLKIILPYSFLGASVGLIESLLTLTLVDEITETRGRGNKECIGQGLGNIICGLFSAMGGCAMIGQSMININSGGRSRLSGIVAGSALLLFVLVGAKLIEIIPVAALVGVMITVVISTFSFSSIKIIPKIPRTDAFIIVLVSAVTVIEDLATAVFVGVIVSSLAFAWKKGSQIEFHSEIDQKGSKVYRLRGSLFFGSVRNFAELFNPADDPTDVIIDFHYARVFDHSGIEAINSLAERYIKLGKTLHLIDLSQECTQLIDNAGDLIDIQIYEDLKHWHVATDKLA